MKGQLLRGLLIAPLAFSACLVLGCEDLPRESPVSQARELPSIVHDSLALPVRIATLGDYLVVGDAALDPTLHVFSAVDGSLIQSLGPEGEGPFEFKGLRGLAVAGTYIWVFDSSLQRLTRVSLQEGVAALDSLVSVRVAQPVTGPVWVGDTLISLGLFEEGRLAIIHPVGDTILSFFGAVPALGDSVPARVAQQAYRAELYVRPGRRQLVALARHADRLEFFNLEGDSSRVVMGPDGFGPQFTLGNDPLGPAFTTGPDLRFGYIDAAPMSQHLIALYSGRTRREARGRANFGQVIRTFDWRGNLVKEKTLDELAIGIAVDDARGVLYAVAHAPQPRIMRIPLSEVLPDRESTGR